MHQRGNYRHFLKWGWGLLLGHFLTIVTRTWGAFFPKFAIWPPSHPPYIRHKRVPLALNGQHQAWMKYQPKLNRKYTPFLLYIVFQVFHVLLHTLLTLHCISTFSCTSFKNFKDTAATSSFTFRFALPFTSTVIIFFHNFLELHSTLTEKIFSYKFSFFNGCIQTPQPLPP